MNNFMKVVSVTAMVCGFIGTVCNMVNQGAAVVAKIKED